MIYAMSTTTELPGNHILARMSHEATIRSMNSGLDASARQRADALSHDWSESAGTRERTCWDASTPQDCVDEALLESFPASDPPAFIRTHA